MPTIFLTCPICGFDGSIHKFEAVPCAFKLEVDPEDDRRLIKVSVRCPEVCPEHTSHDIRWVCKGECRGLRLSWRQRKKIQRDLQNWSR